MDYTPKHVSNILFTIGTWEVRTYSVTMMLGMLFSILAITYFWRRQKYSWEHLQVLVLIIIPVSLIGARLWHVIYASTDKVNYPDFNAKRDWYKIWEGGLAIQGGVIGAAIAGLIYVATKRKSIDMRTAADYILPAVLIGQAIGRWGNFANHEVYGKLDPNGKFTFWLGQFISDNMFITDENGVSGYRIPLFFYEFLTSMIGVVVLVGILNVFNWQKPGTTGGGYFLWYGIVRVIMEPMRPSSESMMWGTLDAGIFTSIVYIIVGTIIIGYSMFDNYIKALYKIIKNKNMSLESFKKEVKTEKENYKYIRVAIQERYFFITFPLKVAVVCSGIFVGAFSKGKVELLKKEKAEKMKTVKGNTFTLNVKKAIIWISYLWNHVVSTTKYVAKRDQLSKKFAEFKVMNWKFKTHIWTRKTELHNFQKGE